MSRKAPKIYRRRNPVKIILIVFGSLLLTAILLFLMLFYGFKKYVVYSDEGAKLEVPWLEEYRNTDNFDIIY